MAIEEQTHEHKRERMIQARNILGAVFHESKSEWCDGWWTTSLTRCLGELDDAINKINLPKPKGIGKLQ